MLEKVSHYQLLTYPGNYVVDISEFPRVCKEAQSCSEIKKLLPKLSAVPVSQRWLVIHSPYADDENDYYRCGFVGWVKETDDSKYMNEADLVLISDSEGFGPAPTKEILYGFFYKDDPKVGKLLKSLLPEGHNAELPDGPSC